MALIVEPGGQRDLFYRLVSFGQLLNRKIQPQTPDVLADGAIKLFAESLCQVSRVNSDNLRYLR